MKVLLFLVLFVGFSVVKGLTVQCYCSRVQYLNSREFTCTARGLQIVEPFVNITNVLETSYSVYNPKDVKGFQVIDQNMEYLPYKFDVFPELSFLWVQNSNQKFILKTDFTNLPKLEHIHFHEGEITEIDKDTFVNTPELWYIAISHHKIKTLPKCLFRNLAKLKHVSFHDNQLEVIDGDLFKNNPMIDVVRFNNNHLKIIGTNLLENLRYLEIVWLQKNECIDMQSEDYAIYQIKNNYQKKCSNETFEIESKMKNCIEPATSEKENHTDSRFVPLNSFENESKMKSSTEPVTSEGENHTYSPFVPLNSFENESKMKSSTEPATSEGENHTDNPFVPLNSCENGKMVILLIITTTLMVFAIVAALVMYKKTPKITEFIPNASYNTKTDNLNMDSTVDEEPFYTTLSTV